MTRLPEHLRPAANLRYSVADLIQLIQMLDDERDYVWEIAFALLTEIGQPAVKYLMIALRSESWQTRMLSAALLGRAGDVAAIKPLLPLLRDPDAEVREAARGAVRRLLAILHIS